MVSGAKGTGCTKLTPVGVQTGFPV